MRTPADSDPAAFADLTLATGWVGDQAVIAVCGEVDLATAPRLRAELELVRAAHPRAVSVDLSRAAFFDLPGVSALTRARWQLATDHAALQVRGASPFHRRLLTLCGLAELLDPPATRPTDPRRPVPPPTG